MCSLTFIGTVVELVSPNWKVWCVAKILMGMAMGFMQGNTQTYVSELAHVRIRGFMLALFQFWIIVGCFLAACVLQGTSQIDGPWSWKAAVISQLGVGAVCLLVYVLSTPESPYYFAGRNNTEGARASLLKLHGGRPGYNVDEELGAIMAAIEHERAMASGAESGTYVECFRSTNLRRTLLACLPMAMQQFGGYTLCNNYLAYFLRQSGLGDPFLITVVANCLSIVAVMACFALVEKVGRRPQILWGYAAMIPCLLAITILGWVGVGTAANDSALSAFSIIWNVFYFMSVGSIGWTMAGEMSSMRLRAKTTSLATIANAVFNLGWAIATPYLINADEANLGPKAGIVFLGPSIILAVVAYFVVPETKGTSFAQLDRLFESRTPARKFHP